MPVFSKSSTDRDLERLRPYEFHGVDLSVEGSHAVGDCPFCGRDGKFSVDVATGLWRCFVCAAGTAAGGGNGLVFTRLVHEHAAASITSDTRRSGSFASTVANDRRLLSVDTPQAWGMAPARDGAWLVPGYGADGRLDQVYRRTHMRDKESGEWYWVLLPTPGIWPEGKVHALHMPTEQAEAARAGNTSNHLWVMEGLGDGMAISEVCAGIGVDVVAVPGCNVWRDEWTERCRGKHVTLFFDSDQPKEHTPGKASRAGYDGIVRVAKRLSGVAASVRWLKWGPDGYDPGRPSGWDVRDHLTSDRASEQVRKRYLSDLLTKVEDAPRGWFNTTSHILNGQPHHEKSVEALPCSTFTECEEAWKKAMLWREELSQCMTVLLAVCASTKQAGNQLFLDLIGSPGSAKTTLVRSLLVSGHCVHLENISKLITGYKKPGEDDKDCSFLARSNNKTWVTCEFDTLANSPQYHDLMGKVRRIFDGETSATYGNSDEDRIYTALRTPWIRAGTPKMMDHDQSQLGDRFMRFLLSDPTETDKRLITRAALRQERSAILETANCTTGSLMDAKTRHAYALTGGYVDWLRANIEDAIQKVDITEANEDYCIDLAELSADLRSRPYEPKHGKKDTGENHEYKELPTRLARQNIRLASCLAVVLNKTKVDTEVLHIVRKVALDTASGHSLNIIYWLFYPNPRHEGKTYQDSGGLSSTVLGPWLGMGKERVEKYLAFMAKMGILEIHQISPSLQGWIMTDRMLELYLRVMKG